MEGTAAVLARQVSTQELAGRRRAATEAAKVHGLDALVVWSKGGPAVDYYGDVLYLANHFPAISSAEPDTELWSGRSYAALILPVEGDPVLIVDIPEYDDGCIDIVDVRPSMNVAVGVALALKGLGLQDKRLGLVGHHVFLASHDRMITAELGAAVAWKPADDILTQLRSIKSDAEVELIRQAAHIGMGWMASMLDAATPGVTEGAIAGAGLAFLAEHGGIPADIDMASGPYAHRIKSHFAIPSWDLLRPIESGDLFHVDGWGSIGGYFTDTARTTVVGADPNPSQTRIIEGSIALVEHLIDGMRPDVLCSDVYARGTAWMRDNGFADQLGDVPHAGCGGTTHIPHGTMWPYFGHGIGLGLEGPWLTAENHTPLQKNMTLAVEVYFNAPDGELAGFEHNIVITNGRPEVMTSALRARWWT